VALIRPFAGRSPSIAEGAFIAETATIIGDVSIGPGASVWYGAVLRADVGRIVIGARSNVQDLACVHLTGGISHTVVGEEVTIGHGVILHGATVHDGALIGMGSIVLDNALIGEEALVAAGSVVTPRTEIPRRFLARGSPAKAIRELREDEWTQGRNGAAAYLELSKLHA
jgi:gamma-carbonic anhydrase